MKFNHITPSSRYPADPVEARELAKTNVGFCVAMGRIIFSDDEEIGPLSWRKPVIPLELSGIHTRAKDMLATTTAAIEAERRRS